MKQNYIGGEWSTASASAEHQSFQRRRRGGGISAAMRNKRAVRSRPRAAVARCRSRRRSSASTRSMPRHRSPRAQERVGRPAGARRRQDAAQAIGEVGRRARSQVLAGEHCVSPGEKLASVRPCLTSKSTRADWRVESSRPGIFRSPFRVEDRAGPRVRNCVVFSGGSVRVARGRAPTSSRARVAAGVFILVMVRAAKSGRHCVDDARVAAFRSRLRPRPRVAAGSASRACKVPARDGRQDRLSSSMMRTLRSR